MGYRGVGLITPLEDDVGTAGFEGLFKSFLSTLAKLAVSNDGASSPDESKNEMGDRFGSSPIKLYSSVSIDDPRVSICIGSSSCGDPFSGYREAVAAPMKAVIKLVVGAATVSLFPAMCCAASERVLTGWLLFT